MKAFATILTSALLAILALACGDDFERPPPAGYTIDGATYSDLGDPARRDAGDAGDASDASEDARGDAARDAAGDAPDAD